MGSLTMIQGDLFNADTDAIAQGCNCRGRMGAGIAAVFRKREPEMFKAYEDLCNQRLFSAGSVMSWRETNGNRTIFNLGTQLAPGASADRRFISIAFKHMADVMWKMRLESVGLPLIGCGIGGLSWQADVRPLVQNLAERVNVQAYYLDKKDLN